MMYSQDGFGLGHMRRTNNLSHELLALRPDLSILTLADSPLGQFFEPTPNSDYLKLPSIVKGSGGWDAVSLPVSFDDVRALRAEILRSAVLTYRPDVLLVDHMPHGAMGELLPTLALVQTGGLPTKTVLGLRDILDSPTVVRRRWRSEGGYEALDRYYDRVLVYGVREVFDLAKEYAVPARVATKVRYCGYVTTPAPARYASRVRAEHAPPRSGRKLVVAMAGGGADAYPLMRTLLDAVPAVDEHVPVNVVVVAGPFMPVAERRALQAQAAGIPAKVKIQVSDPLSYLEAADLVVAMCGYNTTTEILRSRTPAVIVPRPGPSAEQRTRAELFAARGWVDHVDPDDLAPDLLAKVVVDGLVTGRDAAPDLPPVDGLGRAAAEIVDLIPG
jgi:predicted glycosyltransferase